MTPSVNQAKTGTCGCSRSPTGDCIGWHSLSEQAFQQKLSEWQQQNADKLTQSN